jgi:hypothetical protein
MRLRLFSVLFVFFASACASALPAARPPGARIDFSFSAGMLPQGFSTNLTEGGCTYTERSGSSEKHFEFKLSPSELDGLWGVLRENKLDRLKTDPGIVYDKGGYSVSVSWGDETHSLSESGASISKGSQAAWDHIVEALLEVLRRERAKASVPLAVHLDPSVRSRALMITIQGANEPAWLDTLSHPGAAPEQVSRPVLPGPLVMSIVLGREKPDAGAEAYSRVDLPLQVPAVKAVRVSADGDALHAQPEP